MKKVYLDGKEIYLEDREVPVGETGIFLSDGTPLEHTQELPTITEEDALSDTLTDLWGDVYE